MYRAALAELFSAEHHIEALSQKTENAEADAMMYVIEMFKRREIYRHLSNGADRLEHGLLGAPRHRGSDRLKLRNCFMGRRTAPTCILSRWYSASRR